MGSPLGIKGGDEPEFVSPLGISPRTRPLDGLNRVSGFSSNPRTPRRSISGIRTLTTASHFRRLMGSRPELFDMQTRFDPQFFRDHPRIVVSSTPRPTPTCETAMGNSASPGLGSGCADGLRDVRTADPETEVERPPTSPEPNRKSKESNTKSHKQLPVPPKPYNDARRGTAKFKCRIRGPAQIPTTKSKIRPARVPPPSREEPVRELALRLTKSTFELTRSSTGSSTRTSTGNATRNSTGSSTRASTGSSTQIRWRSSIGNSTRISTAGNSSRILTGSPSKSPTGSLTPIRRRSSTCRTRTGSRERASSSQGSTGRRLHELARSSTKPIPHELSERLRSNDRRFQGARSS